MNSEIAPLGMDQGILLETIVVITEQRDQHFLELSLLDALRNMLQPQRCFFLDLPANGPPRIVMSSCDEDVVLPKRLIALARGMPEYDFRQANTPDLAYMLAVLETTRDDGRRVLLVGMPSWNDASERLLVGMVRVCQNFMKLMSDSEKDTLTGLHNRRKLESHLAARLAAHQYDRREGDHDSAAHGKGEYLAMIDLDRFKHINDSYGHLIGDEVLLVFAGILRATLRDNDRSFRYGGEEFIVVLHDVSPEQAARAMERLRGNVEHHRFPQVGQVTISIGYTRIDRQDLPPQVIEEADKALYFAKEHGRNQVRYYSALCAEGAVAETQYDGSVDLF